MSSEVSLLWEVDEVRAAVDAARLLADQLHQQGFQDEASAKLAPRAFAGVLNLATLRLTQLGAVLRGDLSGAWIRAPHNVVDDETSIEDPDVFFDAQDRRQRWHLPARPRREEIADRETEPIGDPVERRERHVELAGFDLLQVPVHAARFLRLVERQLLRLAQFADATVEIALELWNFGDSFVFWTLETPTGRRYRIEADRCSPQEASPVRSSRQ